VGGNSELYVYDFPAPGRSRRATPERPRQVLWRTAPPPGDPVRYVDLCWPAMPQLGGRLLSALITREDISRPSGNTRLWWLTLSPDGGSIVAAEPAIAPGSYGPARDPVEERFPFVGVARDGTILLAYLAQEHGRYDWELWLTEIAPAPVPAAAGAS